MNRVRDRLVLRLLTTENMKDKFTASKVCLRKYKRERKICIITTDKTCLHYYDLETKQQSNLIITEESLVIKSL